MHRGSWTTTGEMLRQAPAPAVAAPSPWVPISAARVAERTKNSPCGDIPCLPLPATPLTSGSGRLLPRFLRKKPKVGERKRLHRGRDRTGRTGQTDGGVGLGSRRDSGPRAPLGWGAPGPSSASSCGCGCRALPRSWTLTAGTSAGRCHGGPRLCPSISWGISADPGGHHPSVPPQMDIRSLALCGC